MATSPRQALADAGLPTVRIGGVAFRARVPRAFARSTGDLDLAVTLPRDVDVPGRLTRATKALGALGYRTDPSLKGPSGTDFCAYFGHGRNPQKIDLFLNGVCDFDFREDGRGTGCRIHVDDEAGRDISKEGLLLCKLIADRPSDHEDVAALLLTGFDQSTLLRKIATQLTCPIDGRARAVSTLKGIELMFAGEGPYHPTNPILDQRRGQVCDRASILGRAIWAARGDTT
jgi:hypothetical protein